MKTGILLMPFVLILAVSAWAAPAAKQATPDAKVELKALITELKKTPGDLALREKIIKLVRPMKPAPAVPQEAKRPFIKGVTFQKEAKSVSDYDLAVMAYKEALLIAPWWPEAIYNLALAQESAEKYDEAIATLQLYLLTKPKDAEEAENKMYALEARKEKAEKDAKETEEAKPDFSGLWKLKDDASSCWKNKFIITGDEYTIISQCEADSYIMSTGKINGKNFEGSYPGGALPMGGTQAPMRQKGTLSDDTTTIRFSYIIAPELATTAEAKETAMFLIKVKGPSEWKEVIWARTDK